MINLATITTALAAQLNADAAVSTHLNGRVVERTEPVNEDAGHVPWICVYRGKANARPRTLGLGAKYWQVIPTLRILVQESSVSKGRAGAGAQTDDKLEAVVSDVITAVLADTSIQGTVDMVTEIDWDYLYLEPTRKNQAFQTAVIDLMIEVRSA